MNLNAIYHRPKSEYAHAINETTIAVRIRTMKNDVEKIDCIYGDKYNWSWESFRRSEMPKCMSDLLFDYWEVNIEVKNKRLCYGFLIQDNLDRVWMTERGFFDDVPNEVINNFQYGLFEFPYIHVNDLFTVPSWVKGSVFYHIFVDRFYNADHKNNPVDVQMWGGEPTSENFFGGDLQGVLEKLDYLEDLGVNAIYLSPIFQSKSNHKYDVMDYSMIDGHFGDHEKIKELVDECHKKKMRVILDVVFNHASEKFQPFQDVVEKGEESKFYDWFHIHEWPIKLEFTDQEIGEVDEYKALTSYDVFGFYPSMPKLKTAHPEVKKYLFELATVWIQNYGVDGFRMDVSDEVDHQFWRDFRKLVKGMNSELYLLGEVWHDARPWLLGDQFDGIMNYPVRSLVLDFLLSDQIDAQTFASKVSSLLFTYPSQVNQSFFNILGTHDTPRIATLFDKDLKRMKLALLFQFTYVGIPTIYYGDECGLEGRADPDNRRCMIWEPELRNNELYKFYRELIQLRGAHVELTEGSFQFISASGGCLGYARRKTNGRTIVILINRNITMESINFAFDEEHLIDYFTHNIITKNETGKFTISLDSYGFCILKNYENINTIGEDNVEK